MSLDHLFKKAPEPTGPTIEEATQWAKVHADSLKPDRWYRLPEADPESTWRYVSETAAIAVNGSTVTVLAQFEIPNPDDPQNPQVCTAVATPAAPFVEVPAKLTSSGKAKGSEQRKAEVTIAARVTPEERDRVKSFAESEGLTVSQLIRSALAALGVDITQDGE